MPLENVKISTWPSEKFLEEKLAPLLEAELLNQHSTVKAPVPKLKSVELAFNNMGKSAGFTENALKKFQAATDGTVSKLE